MAHRTVVERLDQFADRAVQFGQREEPPMPQPGQHPTLHELNRNLDLCLVARFAHPRRHDGGAVVRRHVGVAAVDAGFVATGRGDARLEVVAHHLTRDAAKEGEGVDVAANPVRQPLRPARFGIGQVGGTEGGNEDLCRAHLAGDRVNDLDGLPGIIDEQPLTERVALPHGGRQTTTPCGIQIAKPAVMLAPT